MWFEKLMGFEEVSPENVRSNIELVGENLISKPSGRPFQFGSLEIPTLNQLRESSQKWPSVNGSLKVFEKIGNVQDLHVELSNQHALFQAASQFNLLEMIGPHITPEQGIDRYEKDYTQGPACAIACGAGTIYRNYFVPVNGQIGQSSSNQIDCLDLIGDELDNDDLLLWKMRNGYAMPNLEGLLTINRKLSGYDRDQREYLKGLLKVGIQWNTEVTLSPNKNRVSQVYCSALPVAYSSIEVIYWENFARVILEASYEATLWAGLINYQKTGCPKVFLTLVGGGAFGNEERWILESLFATLDRFRSAPLEVAIVSYREPNSGLKKFLADF